MTRPQISEYHCIACGIEVDEAEVGAPLDADLCGYCVTERTNDVRGRRRFAGGLNECGIHREAAAQAVVELWIEDAESRGDATTRVDRIHPDG